MEDRFLSGFSPLVHWIKTEFPHKEGVGLAHLFPISSFNFEKYPIIYIFLESNHQQYIFIIDTKMTTNKPKMKGIFKGFKYISQIFEEDKEDDIQIGFPTDVKHVAHIGWDGPAVDSPSWMKEFSSSPGLHSAPLGPPTGGEKGEPEIKWVSEDANTKRSNRREESTRDLPDVPRSSRRSQLGEGGNGENSPRKRDPTKVKQRRNHSKDSSEGSVKASRQQQQQDPSDSANPGIPDPAKKSRRKKSKESNGTGGSTRPRSKANANADPGPDGESSLRHSDLDPISST